MQEPVDKVEGDLFFNRAALSLAVLFGRFGTDKNVTEVAWADTFFDRERDCVGGGGVIEILGMKRRDFSGADKMDAYFVGICPFKLDHSFCNLLHALLLDRHDPLFIADDHMHRLQDGRFGEPGDPFFFVRIEATELFQHIEPLIALQHIALSAATERFSITRMARHNNFPFL